MQTMKMKTAVLSMTICGLTGLAAGFFLTPVKKEEPVTVVEYVTDNSPALRRMKVSEALVGDLEQRQKLIVLEAELAEDILIDDSFADWDIFKKMQKITIKATGRFTVDLGALTPQDIIFDDFSKQVALRLPRPVIDAITVNEEQTVFHSVEKGLLRFGEIRLSSAEQNEIYRQAKAAMTPRLKLESEQAAENAAKAAVEDLAGMLVQASGVDGYEIVVVWA